MSTKSKRVAHRVADLFLDGTARHIVQWIAGLVHIIKIQCRRDDAGADDLDTGNGTTSLATTVSDPIAPFRIITDYSKKLGDRFHVKAAFMEGKILSEQEIAEISELPGKDALYAKVLGTMIAPITGLAVCLGQILEQKGGSVEAPAAE